MKQNKLELKNASKEAPQYVNCCHCNIPALKSSCTVFPELIEPGLIDEHYQCPTCCQAEADYFERLGLDFEKDPYECQ